jgi:hypothetical protein
MVVNGGRLLSWRGWVRRREDLCSRFGSWQTLAQITLHFDNRGEVKVSLTARHVSCARLKPVNANDEDLKQHDTFYNASTDAVLKM